MPSLKKHSASAAIAAAGAFTIVVALSGCGSSSASTGAASPIAGVSQSLVKAAQSEGEVAWYSVIPTSQTIADAFTKQYGIKVDLFRGQSADVTSRFANETTAKSASADVVTTSDLSFFNTANKSGWLRPVSPAYVPSLSKFASGTVFPTYASAVIFPFGIEWDTACFSKLGLPPLTSYTQLTNPKLKGKIILQDYRQSASGTANEYYLWKMYGDSFMTKLGAQKPIIVASALTGMQQMAAGDGCAVINSTPGSDAPLIKAGAPLKFFIPSNTLGFNQLIGVSAKAPHPKAAQLFMQFLLSNGPGQKTVVAGTGISPLGASVTGGVNAPKNMKLMDLSYQNTAVAARADISRLLGVPAS